jgi:hypothetical protein
MRRQEHRSALLSLRVFPSVAIEGMLESLLLIESAATSSFCRSAWALSWWRLRVTLMHHC